MNGQPPYQPPATPPPYNPGGAGRQNRSDDGWGQASPYHDPMPAGTYPPGYGPQAWDPYNRYAPPGYSAGHHGQPWQPYAPGQQKSNGIGTAGFILALLSLVLCWTPILGFILWLLGTIFSVIGLFKAPRGLAIAGTVISFIGIIALILFFVAVIGLSHGFPVISS